MFELKTMYLEKEEVVSSSDFGKALKKLAAKKIIAKAIRERDYTIKIKNSTFIADEIMLFGIETKSFNKKYEEKVEILIEPKINTATISIFGAIGYDIIDELATILARQSTMLWVIL